MKCALQFAAKQLATDVEQTLESCYVYVLPPQKEVPVPKKGLFRVDVLDSSLSGRFDPDTVAPLLRALMTGGTLR